MVSFEFEKKLFGGKVWFVVFGEDESRAKKAVNAAYDEGLRLSKVFNFYDFDSELSKLNLKRKIVASREFLEVLLKAEAMKDLTGGSYDATLGRTIKERKDGGVIEKLEFGGLVIEGAEVSLTKEGVLVDLGSIAKGYIADKMGEVLREKGCEDFMIDARGDILFGGEKTQVIEIQHPREADKFLCKIALNGEAVATSGDYNQYNEKFENSHIINSKDAVSVTVVAPTLEEADLFATALFVSDGAIREKILRENEGIRALVVTKDLKQVMYNKFEELIHET